jgi:ABC-2 type transport system ATP-binding protein
MQLIYPTSGYAEILGRPLHDLSARRRVGYLPENPHFSDQLTPEELLEYFAALCGCSSSDRRARAAALLDEAGIGAERRQRLRTLSKGMLQRVGIAQALVNDPDVVIFDEPLSGLDPVGRREMRLLILRLRAKGKTVLFSSHVLSDAEAVCGRVAILVRGRLATIGELSDVSVFGPRGWELIVSGLTTAVLERARCAGHIASATPLGGDRYALELPLSTSPDRVLSNLTAAGASVVSLTPLRETLENFFMRQVGAGPGEVPPPA